MGAAVNNAVGGFQAMTQDLLTVLNDIPFSIPPYFALIGRAVVTLEGVALQGDPDYGIITEAYPFVARKLLREDRPEIQRALTEVLYARGGGGDGSSGNMFNSNRLAALVNSAMGVAARNSEGTFIDLDAVPDDAAGPEEVVKYLLSGDGAATSLWKLLEPELESGTDLLLRQSLRKTAATAFASLPQPPRFFGAPLGPAPQDIPAPLLLPRDLRSAISSISSADSSASSSSSSSTTSPVLASENDNNAAGAASAASAASTSAAVLSSVAGNARVVVTTAAELVETLAPPLTREEELLALQLTDVVSGLLGEDVAMVARGEVLTRPDAASRVVASVLDAVEPGTTTTTTAASTASESTASPLASSSAVRSALQLLRNFLPAGQPLSAATAATDGHGHDGMGAESMKLQEAQATLNSLTDEEKARGGEILRRTADRLVLKLEARLAALQ
jgi:aarF domain-containing kinase